MAEDLKKKQNEEQLKEEQLNDVNGGFNPFWAKKAFGN